MLIIISVAGKLRLLQLLRPLRLNPLLLKLLLRLLLLPLRQPLRLRLRRLKRPRRKL
jgi:hypothetical protein